MIATFLATEEFTQFTVVTWLFWMILPVLLASMWLPLRPILIIWVLNFIVLMLIPVYVRQDLSYELLSIGLLQLFIFGSMILLAVRIRNSDHSRLIIQTNKIEKAKHEAESSSQEKSRFLANMSHELRTPLHGILSYAKFAMVSDVKLKKYFNQINNSGERLQVLLDDLLDISKLEAGKMVMNFSLYELDSIIESCVSEQKALLLSNMLSVDVNLDASLPKIECDTNCIGQVIMNLLSNAIKFSPEAGKIVISAYHDELSGLDGHPMAAVHVSVIDNGTGVLKGEEYMIFDKFIQSSEATFTSGGTGLGLAISRELVQAHDGRIWYEHALDGGSIFHVLLPLMHKSTNRK